jgi:hypothetical protein
MQKGKDLENSGTDVGQRPGQPAGPIPGPSHPPFDLVAIRAIYSPGVESHASTHSSSATEEQRREGHHLGEERAELVN